MSVIDDYLETLDAPLKDMIEHMHTVVRQTAPGATEELSYAMPAFKYKGKCLIAIIAHKRFLSLYPFGSVERLGIDLTAYECTSGSIHFSLAKPIPDVLLRDILAARVSQIDKE